MLVAEKAAHPRLLLDNVCLQQDAKKVVEVKENNVRLLVADKAKWKNSEVVEQR